MVNTSATKSYYIDLGKTRATSNTTYIFFNWIMCNSIQFNQLYFPTRTQIEWFRVQNYNSLWFSCCNPFLTHL